MTMVESVWKISQCYVIHYLSVSSLVVSLTLSGSLNLLVHTATRYNQCCIVHLPAFTAEILYSFICKGDSHSHHSVTRCLYSKLPVSAEGQVAASNVNTISIMLTFLFTNRNMILISFSDLKIWILTYRLQWRKWLSFFFNWIIIMVSVFCICRSHPLAYCSMLAH